MEPTLNQRPVVSRELHYPCGYSYPKKTQNICITFVQCQRRWADVVQMLYKGFVFAGMAGRWDNFAGQNTISFL